MFGLHGRPDACIPHLKKMDVGVGRSALLGLGRESEVQQGARFWGKRSQQPHSDLPASPLSQRTYLRLSQSIKREEDDAELEQGGHRPWSRQSSGSRLRDALWKPGLSRSSPQE